MAVGISRAVLAVLIAIAIAIAAGAPLRAEVPYSEPNFSKPLFSVDALSLEGAARREIVEALAALAGRSGEGRPIDNHTRMKALAVALRLDSMNVSAREANDALIEGRVPAAPEGSPGAAGISDFLWETAIRLEAEDIEDEDARLAPYLRDIAIAVDPSKASAWSGVARWDGVLGPGAPAGGSPGSPPASGESAGKANDPDHPGGPAGDPVREKIRQAIAEKRGVLPGGAPGAPPAAAAEFRRGQSALGVIVFETPGKPEEEKDQAVACVLTMTVADGERVEPENPFYCEEGMSTGVFAQLQAVAAQIQKKYRVLPEMKRLDFKLTTIDGGRALPMDDPRLGVAMLFLLDSLLSGAELDSAISVVGGLAADGGIVSRGGRWWAILEAAAAAGVKTVIVPPSAAGELTDHLVAGEILPVLRVQALAVDGPAEIASWLAVDRDAAAVEAMRLFGEIQDYSGPLSPENLAANVKTQERLATVLAAIPQHLSARLLLAYGKGEIPERFSLEGSVRQIDAELKRVLAIANPEGVAVLAADQDRACTDSLFTLRRVRPKMAVEASEYCDTATDLIERMRKYLQLANRSSSGARQQADEMGKVKARLDEQREKLRAMFGEEKT